MRSQLIRIFGLLLAMFAGALVYAAVTRWIAPPVEQRPVVDDKRQDPVPPKPPIVTSARGKDVVLWMSIDGLRSDYLERAKAPRLHKLMAEGIHSLELEPIFPAITFPSHISQVTGVRVAQHGIPSNTFWDSATRKEYRYYGYSNILEAEPIWTTATRQGVRVCVHDWALSHGQRGKHAAVYSQPQFDSKRTDPERLELLLKDWTDDDHDQPLRLVMGYVVGIDKVGHEKGPDGPEVIEALDALDVLLADFLDRAVNAFEKHRQGDEQLYVLFTTDHGMSPVHTLVNLALLAGLDEQPEGIVTNTVGNVGHIFFDKNMPDRAAAIEAALAKVNEAPEYARAWKRENLPKEWEFAHPTRVGDVVAVVDRGHTFSKIPKDDPTRMVDGRGPFGMHGYDPATNPEMLGPLILWRYPQPLKAQQLGRVHALQLHATVSKLLDIEPSAVAKKEGIVWEK